MPSSHLSLCYLFLPLPSILLSIQVFSNESGFPIRWPKHWSFCFGISPSNEHSGLISFRIDWSSLLVVPGTLKSLLWYHNLKASILQCSAFMMDQFSHLYLTTKLWKNHSFDYVDRRQQSDVSAFENAVWVCHSFPSKEQASLTAINI